MSDKSYIKIGEMAKMFNINVQTLHVYDREGILVPSYRNPENGWRMYDFYQINQLAVIRYLRSIDTSLEDIKTFMQERDTDTSIDNLRHQSARLRKRYRELILMDDILQSRLNLIEIEKRHLQYDRFVEVSCKERYYLDLGHEDEVYQDKSFYYYPTIVFYRGKELTFASHLFERERDARVLPKATYLTGYYQGDYDHIWDKIDQIRREAGDPEAVVICTNIIDLFLESNPDHYITKLQVKLT